jgi:hypothetical protein
MDAKKMTAVEWFIQQLPLGTIMNLAENGIYLNQAIAMEKEQIKNAYINGSCDCEMLPMDSDAEQYYNETYNK